ncbi:MAG TPA: DUF3347 domain-containing protein [Puia sp.]|jgi:hypothetical protein
MKKLFFAAALIAAVLVQPAFAQQSMPLSPILNDYYGIKDALVADNAKTAAAKAGDLLKAIDGVDMKALPEKDHMAYMSLKEKLSFDARHISESTNIDHQREHFMALSANMDAFAKKAHLSGDPIYEDYCPMKKAYWLSSGTDIKNPFYGKSMLTCGKVNATLKP